MQRGLERRSEGGRSGGGKATTLASMDASWDEFRQGEGRLAGSSGCCLYRQITKAKRWRSIGQAVAVRRVRPAGAQWPRGRRPCFSPCSSSKLRSLRVIAIPLTSHFVPIATLLCPCYCSLTQRSDILFTVVLVHCFCAFAVLGAAADNRRLFTDGGDYSHWIGHQRKRLVWRSYLKPV